MEIKIDIDINKIDYDAINKQISEKIAEMDLAANYNFKYKIENRIDEEVANTVSEFFRAYRWGTLTDSVRSDMKDMVFTMVRQIINPHVENLIAQIPQEEMNNIIIDLIPRVLVDIMSNSLKDTLYSYWNNSTEAIINRATTEIRSHINV